MMNGTEVEVEDYEEVIGDLNYAARVEERGLIPEPTLNQNNSSLTPQNRPTLRSIFQYELSRRMQKSRFLSRHKTPYWTLYRLHA